MLRPPLCLLSSPTCAQDFELAGHLIPKGARLQCSLAQVMLTDARWAGQPDAAAFRPERWLTEEGRKPGGAWIPFGGGARLCLGWLLAMAEMKALLAAVARSGCAFRPLEPDEPWLLFPLARPVHGMPCAFASPADEPAAPATPA